MKPVSQLLLVIAGAFLGALVPITYSTLAVNAKVEQRVEYIESTVREHDQELSSLRRLNAGHEARLLRNEETLRLMKEGLCEIKADLKKLLRQQ